MRGATLLVGASGRLGKAVAERLLERGAQLRAGIRDPSKRLPELSRAGAVPLDLRKPETFSPALVGVQRVLTAAHGLTGRRRDSIAKVDIDGHKRLIDAAAKAGVMRFVYTSVYGASADHELPFMRAKVAVEHYLAASGLDHVILRPTAFLDLYAHDLIGAAVVAGKRVFLLGRGTTRRNFVAVADVAAAAVAALERDDLAGRTLEIGGSSNLSDREVAAIYGRLCGKAPKIVALPPAAVATLAMLLRPFHAGAANILQMVQAIEGSEALIIDGATTASLIGREPTSVEEFVRRRL